MSDAATTEPAAEPATGPAADVGLDRVMLAMDVVDTLRHQREIVDLELDDDRRQQELVARIRAIYDSQGIEVDDEVIADGVAALREDRFVYTPPARSFEVWLAEIYVERVKWLLRAGIVGAVLLAIWGGVAIPRYIGERNAITAFEDTASSFALRSQTFAATVNELRRQLDAAAAVTSPVAVPRLFDEAENALLRAQGHAETFATALERLPVGADYVADRERWDAAIAVAREVATDTETAFSDTRDLLSRIGELRRLHDRVEAVAGRLPTLGLGPAELARAQSEARKVGSLIQAGDDEEAATALFELENLVQTLVTNKRRAAELVSRLAAAKQALTEMGAEQAAVVRGAELAEAFEAAMASGQPDVAARRLGEFETLIERLGQVYELRILTRRNERSGVWRHPNRDRQVRNHYIIVEAIGPDGDRLTLPIENEETGRTTRVRRFGIRVSEATFEQVKADKLDNGIIDRARFGTKRRGRLEPEYSFPVVGGRITRW